MEDRAFSEDVELDRVGFNTFSPLEESISNASEERAESSEQTASGDNTLLQEPQRRGRGRPRVSRVRDETAIEKRRAQVRNAQRTYQKRKEDATANTNKRCLELLQALSDVSTAVEELLRLALKSGALDLNDEMAGQLRRLWAVYDATISGEWAGPELKLLQVKNDSRKADRDAREQAREAGTNVFNIGVISKTAVDLSRGGPGANPLFIPSCTNEDAISRQRTESFGRERPRDIEFGLGRVDDSTLLQSFKDIPSARTMIDIVRGRQAQQRRSGSGSS